MYTLNYICGIINNIIDKIIILITIILLLFSTYSLIDTFIILKKSSGYNFIKYKPQSGKEEDNNLIKLQKLNNEVIGWITIDNTKIDYPIVQANNNSKYLNKDVLNNYAISGSIFLDSRNDSYLKDYFNILYGHNMKNGNMFGSIQNYTNKKYLEEHNKGTIIIKNKKYNIEILALMKVDANNKIYNLERKPILSYIKNNSIFYNNGIKDIKKILALSTCTSGSYKRLVLICSIKE